MKTITVRMDDKLHSDFKIICTQLGVSMDKQLQAFLVAFVAKHGDKLPPPPKGK